LINTVRADVTELRSQDENVNNLYMDTVQLLNPTSEKFADFTALKPFANAYGANETDLSHELHQEKRLVKRLDSVQKPKSKLALILCLERYKEAFTKIGSCDLDHILKICAYFEVYKPLRF